MKLWISFCFTVSVAVFGNIDPVKLNSKIYAMYGSKSSLCTSPVLLFSKELAIFYDVFGFPTLGTTDNKDHSYDGTYHCLIFKMSERFQFRPNIDGGLTCLFTQDYTQDFCSNGSTTTGVDGTQISCTDSGDETVYLYLSTASTNNDPSPVSNAFNPPTNLDSSKGVKLDNPFVIYGPTTGRLVVNGLSRISASSGSCVMGLPKFSFVKE